MNQESLHVPHPTDQTSHEPFHGTTVLSVRKDGQVIMAADGQVTQGSVVFKSNATKVRQLKGCKGLVGFAGATADAFTLLERFEAKLEKHTGHLTRAAVELARDWRTDRYLRRLEALIAVADSEKSLILSGTGDVIEPEDGLIGIGSGGAYALAAARALLDLPDHDAEMIALKSMRIAGDLCIYTNHQLNLEKLSDGDLKVTT